MSGVISGRRDSSNDPRAGAPAADPAAEPSAIPGDREIHVDQRLQTAQVVDAAADLSEYLLSQRSERLRHSEAVALRAEQLVAAVDPAEAPLLVAAAWLHDIGYATELQQTGFHPLDGGLHLQRVGWPDLVSGLVAHHSGARYVAAARHLDAELAVFTYRETALADALTVADQTAGPTGTLMTVDERLDDMLSRHGSDSTTPQRIPDASPTSAPPPIGWFKGSKQQVSTSTSCVSGNAQHLSRPSSPEPAHVF